MSVNLTLETLASKGINDSSVSGATIKDALETLELATNGSGKVYGFTGTITALTTGQALTLNGDPDALLDFDHDLIYLGKVGYWEVTGAVLGTAFVANLSGGPFFAYFNNPGIDTQSNIFIAGNNQTVYANGTASTGSIQFTPTEVSADKWHFVCTDNTCTENCEVTFYIFVDTILNPATGAITTPNAGAGGLTDGTYGDIAVSGSGTNLQIVGGAVGASELANNAVTDAKINTGAVTLPKIGATGAGAGKVLTTDGTTMSWETPAGGLDDGDYGDITVSGGGTVMSIDNAAKGIIPLVTTFADCENTSSEIDIVTVTIPANTLAVGDLIKIVISSVTFNNSGSNFTLEQKIMINDNTIVNPNANAITSSTSLRHIRHELAFYALNVSGNNIDLVQNNLFSGTGGLVSPIALTFPTTSTTYTSGVRHTPATVDKTASNTVYIKLKWSGANANTYVRNYEAQSFIIKKAV